MLQRQQLVQCDSLGQLTSQLLSDGEVQYIAFDQKVKTYHFKSGKSFYKAFKLDKNIRELTVTVSGLLYNTAFSPQDLLLDSQFNKTRIIGA